MSFLNPTLLAFSAAIAVPILIHLLNRRRFRRITWAAMRFLRASVERNRRRMQWEDLILLLLRCLIVVLLAMALARPALRSAASFLQTGRAAAVIVLDDSASLAANDGTGPRFDLARQAAEAALDSFPSGSSIAVLFGGDGPQPANALTEPTYDLNLARQTLRDAAPSDLGTDHAASVLQALEILENQTALRKEVVLVTDRQAWGWRRLPEILSALAEVSRDTRLRVVFAGQAIEDNLALSALTRSPGFASAGEPLRFHAEIANRGSTEVRTVRATLHLDDGPPVDEAVIESLPAGGSRRLTFFAKPGSPGYHAVSARLPPDRLPADDERTVILQAVESVRVLVVEGDPGSNSAFFLRHALQPVPEPVATEYFLQPRVITAGQLALTRLAGYDAVIITDIATLPPPAVDALGTYLREGGALLWFPGPASQPAFHNQELAGRAGLLPATLAGIQGNPEAEDEAFSFAAGPYEHPVFALWNESGAGSLTRIRFRAAWTLVPLPARTNASSDGTAGKVMARFENGSPAVVEASVGHGRTLLFASTAGISWNDLAVRPAFVPLLHRAIASVAESGEAGLNITTGTRLNLPLSADLIGKDVVVTMPGTPERRLTRTLHAGPEGAVLEVPETRQAGAYWVRSPGSQTVLAAFGAQIHPAETDLAEVTAERLAEIEQGAHVVDWAPGTDLRTAFDRERVGVELWLPMAMAVLLLGIAETWLAQQFSRSK
jgi:hypothetical protein